MPNPFDPQTFNRYSYVTDNPVNLVDPSGFNPVGPCEPGDTTCWEDRWFNAQGLCRNRNGEYKRQCKAEARDKDIVKEVYGVTVLGEEWTANRLSDLVEALRRTSIAFEGLENFRATLGDFSVFLIPWDLGDTLREFTPPPPILSAVSPADIILSAYTFGHGEKYAIFSIIHEIGHLWDERSNWSHSNGMMNALGTKSCELYFGCFYNSGAGSELPPGFQKGNYASNSSWEDWAESFATYVYPDYYGNPNPPARLLGPRREQFVKGQILDALRVTRNQ